MPNPSHMNTLHKSIFYISGETIIYDTDLLPNVLASYSLMSKLFICLSLTLYPDLLRIQEKSHYQSGYKAYVIFSINKTNYNLEGENFGLL